MWLNFYRQCDAIKPVIGIHRFSMAVQSYWICLWDSKWPFCCLLRSWLIKIKLCIGRHACFNKKIMKESAQLIFFFCCSLQRCQSWCGLPCWWLMEYWRGELPQSGEVCLQHDWRFRCCWPIRNAGVWLSWQQESSVLTERTLNTILYFHGNRCQLCSTVMMPRMSSGWTVTTTRAQLWLHFSLLNTKEETLKQVTFTVIQTFYLSQHPHLPHTHRRSMLDKLSEITF